MCASRGVGHGMVVDRMHLQRLVVPLIGVVVVPLVAEMLVPQAVVALVQVLLLLPTTSRHGAPGDCTWVAAGATGLCGVAPKLRVQV